MSFRPIERSGKEQVACMEKFGTVAYHDGTKLKLWEAIDFEYQWLPPHAQRLPMPEKVDYCKSFMKRQRYHCMKCNVNCNIYTHFCHDCILLSPLGQLTDKCSCVEKCEMSVLPKHKEL